MILGSWTLEGLRGFAPAELAAAIGEVSDAVELFYIDAISHAQPSGWEAAVHSPAWTRLTFTSKGATRMQLHIDRRSGAPDGPFAALAEVEGDAGADELARSVLSAACTKLSLTLGTFDPSGK